MSKFMSNGKANNVHFALEVLCTAFVLQKAKQRSSTVFFY